MVLSSHIFLKKGSLFLFVFKVKRMLERTTIV